MCSISLNRFPPRNPICSIIGETRFHLEFKALGGLAASRKFVQKDAILVTGLKIAEQIPHLNLAMQAKPTAILISNGEQIMVWNSVTTNCADTFV